MPISLIMWCKKSFKFFLIFSESRGWAGLRAAGRQDQAEDQGGEHADQGHNSQGYSVLSKETESQDRFKKVWQKMDSSGPT